jgi:fatty-acyl-CoA synthase
MAQPRPGTLEALAAAAPDQIVLIEHGTGRTRTRHEWDERAGDLAAALAHEFGIGHGGRVALDFANPVLELFESTFALAKLGAIPIHLMPGPKPWFIDDALALSMAEGLITDRAWHTFGGTITEHSWHAERPGHMGARRYEDLIAGAPAGPRPQSGIRVAPLTVSAGPDKPFFHERLDDRGDRSGLAVVLGDLVARARHRQGRSHLVAAPTWIQSTLTHAGVTLLAGGAVVTLPDFTPEDWLDAVAEHEVATAVLTSGMLAAILALPAHVLETADTTSLDCVLVTGGSVDVSARLAAVDLFGEDQVALLYATPAAGPVAVLDPADVAEDPGTVGPPLRGVHVTIRDDAGTSVPRGTVGQIHVTSPLATGEDVATGDRGYRDAEGRLCVVD